MTPRPPNRTYGWVQGLRGVAAVMVAYHNTNFTQMELVGTRNFWLAGGLLGEAGVDLFFVLSGFLMVRTTLADTPGPALSGRFLMSRASRIYPAYWVVAGLWAVVLAVWPAASLGHPSAPLWRALALLPSAEPPQLVQAWSLIFEVYFYLVFGLLLMVRRLHRRLLLIGLAVWLGIAAVTGVAPPGAVGALISNPLSLEFLIGCLIALAPEGRVAGSLLLAAAGALAMFAGEIGRGHLPPDQANLWRALLVGLPAGAVLLGAVAFETRSGLDAPRWLKALGARAFAIYLVNAPVAACLGLGLVRLGVAASLGPLARDTLYVAGTVLLTLGLGEALHRGVERPSLALSRRLRRREREGGADGQAPDSVANPQTA